MSDQVRIVQDLYAAFLRGDIPAILERMSEDVDFHQNDAPDLPYGGHYKGRADVGSFFKKLGEAVEMTSFTPRRYIADGDEVVALGEWSGRARPTGKPFSSRWAMHWTLRDGKVVAYDNYEDTGATAAAFRA